MPKVCLAALITLKSFLGRFYFKGQMKQQYFPHDSGAGHDEKIVKLLKKCGYRGYGIFWALIERLHTSTDGWYSLDFELLAYTLHEDQAIIESVIKEFNLFVVEETRFTSNRVQKDIKDIQIKREKAIASISHRWGKENPIRTNNERNTNVILESKESKESKESNNVPKKPGFTPPTIQQCLNHCIEKNITVDCQDFIDFYGSKNWMVGKTKMANWKSALSRAAKWEHNLNGHATKPKLMDGF